MTVATLMFGESIDAAAFVALPALHQVDSLESIEKLFDEYKIAD
jgi:hypothetical protein